MHYTSNLIERVFDQLAKACEKSPKKEDTDGQSRDRMQKVFAAWKFCTKERSLLKKYLFQSGEKVEDLNEMTTQQMRELTAQKKRDDSREKPSARYQNLNDETMYSYLNNQSMISQDGQVLMTSQSSVNFLPQYH